MSPTYQLSGFGSIIRIHYVVNEDQTLIKKMYSFQHSDKLDNMRHMCTHFFFSIIKCGHESTVLLFFSLLTGVMFSTETACGEINYRCLYFQWN